jgi:hypothetical protein
VDTWALSVGELDLLVTGATFCAICFLWARRQQLARKIVDEPVPDRKRRLRVVSRSGETVYDGGDLQRARQAFKATAGAWLEVDGRRRG